jgi:hypothetical protein
LPIVRELLSYVCGGQNQSFEQLVGTSLHGSLENWSTAAAADGQLQVKCPNGRVAFPVTQTTSGDLEWRFSDTEISGIYSLHGLPEKRVQQFAVNVDHRESDLSRFDLKSLPATVTVHTASPNGIPGDDASVALSHAGWSQQLLWAALAIMFFESFIAWRFGRGGA